MFNRRATAASTLRFAICIASCIVAAMATMTKPRRANTVPTRSSNKGLLQQRAGFHGSSPPSTTAPELESVGKVISRRKQGSKGTWDELPDASSSQNFASGKDQVLAHEDGINTKVITSASTSDTTHTRFSFVDGLQPMLSAPHGLDRASSRIDGGALNSAPSSSHDSVRSEKDGKTVNSDADTNDAHQQAESKVSSSMIASTAALPPRPTPLHLALVGIFEEEQHEDEGDQATPQPPRTNKPPFPALSSGNEDTNDWSALWSTKTLASSSAFSTPKPIEMASPVSGFVPAPRGEPSSAAPTIGTAWTLAPVSPTSTSTYVNQQPTQAPAQSYLVPSSPPSPGPTGTTWSTPSAQPAAVPTPLAPNEVLSPTSDVSHTPAPARVARTPSPVSPSDTVYGSSPPVDATPGEIPWTPLPLSGTNFPELSPTEESSSSSNSSGSRGGNSGAEQGGEDSDEREVILSPSPAAPLVSDSPFQQIPTPAPTLGGTSGEVLSTPPTGPPRTPSPMEAGASPTLSPAAQTNAPLARTGGDEEITSLAPAEASRSPESAQPSAVASGSSSSDSTGAAGGTAMPADGSETSFADRYFTFGDSDSSASAPNPTSPTGPPVSVGVPIPSPILDRGGEGEDDEGEVNAEEEEGEEEEEEEEQEEEEGEEGSEPTAFPEPVVASPGPTGFVEGVPTSSSPSTSTRAAIYSTYAPTWSPSPTMTYEYGSIDSEGVTASPSSSVVTSSPTPSSTRWDNQGYEIPSAPSLSPHLGSPVSTAAPTAILPGANDRGGDVSSAPSNYPSFSMADLTAPPTMSSTGGNGEGDASSSAPSSIPNTFGEELTSSPTTISTRGDDQGVEGSLAPSSSPDLTSSVTAMPTPTPTRGSSRGDYSSPAPSSPAPDPSTTAPGPSTAAPDSSTLASTPSPTTTSSGETSRSGESSPAPSTRPDSGDLAVTASPTMGSTGASSRGDFSSSAPSSPPDPSSLALTSSPTTHSTRGSNGEDDISSASSSAPDPSPFPSTSSPTMRTTGGGDVHHELSSAPSSAAPDSGNLAFTASPTVSPSGESNRVGDSSSAPSSRPDSSIALLTSSPTTSLTRESLGGGDVSLAPSSSPHPTPVAVTASPTFTSTLGNARGNGSSSAPSSPPPNPTTTAFTPSPTAGPSGEAYRGREMSSAPFSFPDFDTVGQTASPTTSPSGASSRTDFLSSAPSSFAPTTPGTDYDETFSPSAVVDDPRATTSSPTSSPTEGTDQQYGASSIYSTSPSGMSSASSGNTASPAFSETGAPSEGVRGAGPAPTPAQTMGPTTAFMDRGEENLSLDSPTTSPTMSMTGWTTVPAATYAPSAREGTRDPGDSAGTLSPTRSPLSVEGNPEDVLPTISPSSTSTGGDFLPTDFPSPGPITASSSPSSSPTAREGGGTAEEAVATAAPTSAPTTHHHMSGRPFQPTSTPTGSPSYQENAGGVEANLSPAPSGALVSSWTSSFFWPGDRSPSPTTGPAGRSPAFGQTASPTLSLLGTGSPTTGRGENGSQDTNQPSPSTLWPIFSSSSPSLQPSPSPTGSSEALTTSPSSSSTYPSILWPTASPSASSTSPTEYFPTHRGQASSAPTLLSEEQHPAQSLTPTTLWSPSPSSTGSSFHWSTASPTVAPSDISFTTASPTAFDGERGVEGSEAEEEQPTPVPTLVPAPASDQTKAPSASRGPSSSERDREEEAIGSTIAPTGFEVSQEAETPMPSVSFLTLMPTGRSYSSEGEGDTRSGSSDDDDDDNSNGDSAGSETFAPTGAPVPAIDSDGGVDRGDSETTTPAPSSHGENTWSWWYQAGGERADRGNALVHGVGENAHHRYLVGTEDGVADGDESHATTSTAAAAAATGVGTASRPQQQRRVLQSDTGSGQDICAICLTTDGSELWRHTGGSDGEDVAMCIDASEDHVVIAGYTTGDLYSETNGGDDVFLGLLDTDDGNLVAGWQFGGEGSERAYALGLDEESGDLIVGGYTTSSLFATNANGISQYFVVRLDKSELLLNSLGLIDLTEEDSAAVVWGWQYAKSSTDPEAVVSLRVISDIGLVATLGTRGLPPEWSPRDTDFVPGNGTESLLWSSVLSLDLDTGDLLWNSDEVEGLGTAVAVDAGSGDAYVAGYSVASSSSSSSPLEGDFERIVVYKIEASTGDKVWSYEPTAGPVSNGRALAIEMIGWRDVAVAGTTSGTDTYPSEGGMDAFTLVLGAGSGSETCYYQVGTESVDVVSGISVDNSDSTIYPDVAIVGYTEGSLAGPNAGGTDIFAIGMELETFCPEVQRSTSSAAEAETQGSIAAGTVSIMAGFAIAGAVLSTMVAPAATLASVAVAAGGANTSGGVAATVSTSAATGAAAGAVVTSASAAPASLGGAGAIVTILSAGGGAGGLLGSAPPPGVATYRSPSASIGLLVMMQLQFLATLSLVSSVHDSTSVLSSFVQDLRWVNLWLPIPADLSPASSDCEEADDDALMTEEVFYGNTALVLGLLLAIFVVHVAVVSIVEAYWLAQDRAMAAVKSARQAYGMSATDFDRQQSQGTGRRSLSHGRGRFSAIANMPSGDDLISFEEDSQHGDGMRPRYPSPAPASNVGSAHPDSPPRGLLKGYPNGSPASRTSDCGRDDGRPQEDTPNNGGDNVDDVDESSFSVLASGHQHHQQQAAIRFLPESPTSRSEGAATFFTGDRSSSNHSPATNKTSKSPRAGAQSPAARSSLERRISGRGGRSLPGSPTRGGRRYGGTNELYPHQSTVSSVRSASPSSLHWDSPPRGFAGSTTPSRRVRSYSREREERSTAAGGSKKYDGDNDGSEGGGDDFVDLFYMKRFLSGKADAASVAGCRGGGRRTPALPQQTPTGAVACGSRFDVSTCGAGTAGRSDLGGDGGGLRRRRVNNVDRLQEDPDGQSSDSAADPGGSVESHDNHPILACRRRSPSVWLHFPHLELLFLFWAFEGAVAAQVSALMNAGCSRVFWLALTALLLFPVLMFVMVWRTIAVRVRPNDLLVFRVHETDDQQEGNDGGRTEEEQENNDEPPGEPAQAEDGEVLPYGTSDVDGTQPRRGLWKKFVSLWSDKGMLFSWADTGSWESVATHDEDVKREADWFRIGFEPLFVDLSKLGCYYLIFLMVKWFGMACVGVLVEDSVKQLLYMFVLHAVDLAVLVRGSPFANSVVNAMNVMLTAVDCASSALMLGAAGFDEDETSTFNDIAFFLQLVALIALVIPVYIDTGVALAIFGVEKLSQKCGSRDSGYDLLQTREAEEIEDEQRREYVRRFARRSWPSFWCSMVRHNVLACFDDIRDGVCTPGSSLTRRRRRRQLRRENRKLVRTGRHGCLFQVRCCGIPFQLRCCGAKAAPTVPIPASLPTSCVSWEERARNHQCYMYGGDGSLRKTTQQRQQQQQQHRTWTLPPKLRAVGRAAGSWGGETALMSSRSTGVRRPPSPTGSGDRGLGDGRQHHCRRGSANSMAGWSMNDRDQSWGHDKSSSRGGGWGLGEAGTGLGESASRCGLIPSVFCPTPVPMDEPRRKSFHAMSGSVDLLRGSDGNGGRKESFASRTGSGRGGGGEGQARASGTRRIPSMFSTPPVATEEPRRKANITGHCHASEGGIGGDRVVTAGRSEARADEDVTKSVGQLAPALPDQGVATDEPRRPTMPAMTSSGQVGRFLVAGEKNSDRNGGASGRGLISDSSLGPIGDPQKTSNAWRGLAVSVSSAEGDEEEDRVGGAANKRSLARDGGG